MYDKDGKERPLSDILTAAEKTKLKSQVVKTLHVDMSPDGVLRVHLDGVLMFWVGAEVSCDLKISMPKER
jgi:hypothetical protein